MKTKLRRVIFLIVFLGLIFLSACQAKQSAVFSGQCSAPCWRNIQPGKTSMQDAMTLVKNLQDVDAKTIATAGGPYYIFSDYIKFNLSSGEKVYIYMLENVVAQIHFSLPKGLITFGKCVQEFGPPDYVMQVPALGPGEPFALDAPHIWFNTISLSRGVEYDYDTFNAWAGSNFNLTPETAIVDLDFFDPQEYEKLLAGHSISIDVRSSGEKIHSWKGYGDIRVLYP